MNDILFPFNLGAAKSGTELAILVQRILWERYKDEKEIAFLQIDFKNAFNYLLRSWMRQSIKYYSPDIIPFFDIIYKQYSKIYYSESRVIISTRGYQQGDGLASFGFSLAVFHKFKDNPIIRSIHSDIWYHDDENSCDKLENMDRNLNEIRKEAAEIGLIINNTKTKIYIDEEQIDYKFENDVKINYNKNMEILGSYIGSEEYVKNKLDGVLYKAENGMDCLRELLEIIQNIDDKLIAFS